MAPNALEKQIVARSVVSIPMIIAATALATTAIFVAGAVTGASLLRAGRNDGSARRFESPVTGLAGSLGWTASVAGPSNASIQWATSVVAASSQYSATSWSAARVLGPPDVYPASGDNANAWASLSADGGAEFIEVRFAEPRPLQGVTIAETYNPGAIARIEGIGINGQRVVLFDAGYWGQYAAQPGAIMQHFSGACSPIALASVRVTLNSTQVAGWNELDAIGAVACQ
jgi:hypothetical protein